MREKWTFFMELLSGQKLKYVLALLCVGGSSLMMLLPQQVIRFTVDAVIAGEPFPLPPFLESIYVSLGGRDAFFGNLWMCGLLILLIYLGHSLFSFCRMWLNASASQESTKRLKDKLYNHLNHMPYAAHVSANTGDLLQRCSSDVETVRRFMSTQIIDIVRTLFMFSFAMAIMLNMNATMTYVTIIVVFPLLVFSLWFYRTIRRTFLKVEDAEGRLSTVMQENFTAVRVVRAFGQEKQESDKFDDANQEFRRHSLRMNDHLSVFWSVTDLLIYGQMVITMVTGCILAYQGEISVGMVMSFSAYTTTLLWPVRQLGRALSHLGRTSVALGRIREVLDTPVEEDPTGALTPTIRGDIVFDHVSLAYEEGRDVLKDICFHVSAGETIGILGATGSGKSSMVQLLQRLYDVDAGAIYLDGININEIALKWLRKHVGIVLQEPFLYSRTIMENIRITDPSLPGDEVMRVASIAQIDSLADEFDGGFDTMVGERGVTLSGGQQQRVAIARMLLQDSPIMIFDDSLSALDTETDAAIRKALKENKRDRTTFIISHRVTTLFEADRILVLEDGAIIQEGTHEELLKQEGPYRTVWDIYGRLEIEASLEKGGESL